MSVAVYQLGDLVRVEATFKNLVGVDTDPTTVKLFVHGPDGVTVEETHNPGDIVKTDTGKYYLDIAVDKPGEWLYKWLGTGAAAAAEYGQFMVEPSDFVTG